MGATLADGGVNPVTKERVVDASVCHYALAVMTTAGLYETSGDWLFDIGLPGKSGIGGGIILTLGGEQYPELGDLPCRSKCPVPVSGAVARSPRHLPLRSTAGLSPRGNSRRGRALPGPQAADDIGNPSAH